MVQRVNNNSAFYLPRSNAFVTAADSSNVPPKPFVKFRNETSALAKKEVDIALWGKDNLKPLKWIELLSESNIAPQLLMTKVDFACGERLYTYTEDIQADPSTGEMKIIKVPVQAPPQLQRWLQGIKVEQLMRKRATDYYFSGNCFNQFVLARDPQKYGIAWIDHIDSCDARIEKINNNRRIDHFWVSDDWGNVVYSKKKKEENNTRRFKAFKESDPFKYFRTIYHSKIYWPGQKYYGVQPWHAAENWIGFANRIPVWMTSNIDNSYNIKYHIQYPQYYFDYTLDWSEEDRKKEEERVFQQLDEWLAGKGNVSKTFFSKMNFDPHTGKALDGWKITPIKNEIQDKAWVEAYKTSQGAMTSGWDINPSLANIPQEGKFAVSGSELRIAYQIHIALKVSAARAIMVEPLEVAYRVNQELGVPGFEIPDLKFGFINKNVVTLAESPAGITPENND